MLLLILLSFVFLSYSLALGLNIGILLDRGSNIFPISRESLVPDSHIYLLDIDALTDSNNPNPLESFDVVYLFQRNLTSLDYLSSIFAKSSTLIVAIGQTAKKLPIPSRILHIQYPPSDFSMVDLKHTVCISPIQHVNFFIPDTDTRSFQLPCSKSTVNYHYSINDFSDHKISPLHFSPTLPQDIPGPSPLLVFQLPTPHSSSIDAHSALFLALITITSGLTTVSPLPVVYFVPSSPSLPDSIRSLTTSSSSLPSKTLSEVRIGAFFSPFLWKAGTTAGVDSASSLRLAAFLLALREINQDPSLLPHTKLSFALRGGSDFTSSTMASHYLANQAFGGLGVQVVLGDADTAELQASSQVLAPKDVPQINCLASGSELSSSSSSFSLLARSVPSESVQGAALQRLFCQHFQWSKITIFFSPDPYGQFSYSRLTDGSICPISLLSQHIIQSGSSSFSSQLHTAASVGSTIFVFFLSDPDTGARLLQAGVASGLFHDQTQLVFGARMSGENLATSLSVLLGPSSASRALEGSIGINFLPSFWTQVSHIGRTFLRNFTHQDPTLSLASSTTGLCDPSLDDPQENLVYQPPSADPDTCSTSITQPLPSTTALPLDSCAGISNFSQFSPDLPLSLRSQIDPYAAICYDSVYLLAHALEKLINEKAANASIDLNSNPSLTPAQSQAIFTFSSEELLDSIHSLDLEGASGPLHLSQDVRDSGLMFELLSFNTDYFTSSSSSPFNVAGLVDPDNGFFACDPNTHTVDIASMNLDLINQNAPSCHPLLFNTPSNLPPSDMRSPVILTMGIRLSGTLIFISAGCFLTILFYSGVVLYFYNSKLIAASQRGMLVFILVGGFLGSSVMFVSGEDLTAQTCTSVILLSHLSFAFIFSALIIKLWRIDQIVNTKGIRRVKITNEMVYMITSVFVFFFCLYLILMVALSRITVAYISSTVQNQVISETYCSMSTPAVQIALFLFETICMLYGVYLTVRTKDVPDSINESRFVAFSITVVFCVGMFVFPLINLVPMQQSQIRFISYASYGFCLFSVEGIIFVPKTISLLRSHGFLPSKNHSSHSSEPNRPSQPEQKNSKQEPQSHSSKAQDQSTSKNQLMRAETVDLPSKFMERAVLIKQQIALWQEQLLRLEDMREGDQEDSLRKPEPASTEVQTTARTAQSHSNPNNSSESATQRKSWFKGDTNTVSPEP